jgi:hypothetical protein
VGDISTGLWFKPEPRHFYLFFLKNFRVVYVAGDHTGKSGLGSTHVYFRCLDANDQLSTIHTNRSYNHRNKRKHASSISRILVIFKNRHSHLRLQFRLSFRSVIRHPRRHPRKRTRRACSILCLLDLLSAYNSGYSGKLRRSFIEPIARFIFHIQQSSHSSTLPIIALHFDDSSRHKIEKQE